MRLILCIDILHGLISRVIGLILCHVHLTLRRRGVAAHRWDGPLIRLIRLHITV